MAGQYRPTLIMEATDERLMKVKKALADTKATQKMVAAMLANTSTRLRATKKRAAEMAAIQSFIDAQRKSE